MKASPSTVRCGPYTPQWLQEAIEGVGVPVPSTASLVLLGMLLHGAINIYEHRETARATRARIDKVYDAMAVLTRWINDRREDCKAVRHPAILKRERQLHAKFDAFKEAMASTGLSLPMDAWMAPPLTRWNDFARFIVQALNYAVAENYPDGWKGFGAADDGPAVRFAAAVLEKAGITPRGYSPGTPPAAVIARHLRSEKLRRRRRNKRT